VIALEVLTELRHRGVELTVANGELRYRAPRGVLTPELRATLSAHKTELVAMLSEPAEPRWLDLVDCLALLDTMHAEIRAVYEAGALPWAFATCPELNQRFEQTETAIDGLTAARPTEAEFRRALEAHAAVWRDLVARYRAHQERQGWESVCGVVGDG